MLDGPAATVLLSLLGTGASGRLVWTIYAFLPLIWIPAANTYLGNFIGEFLQSPGRARWIGWLGVVTAVAGLIGTFRNVTTVVAPLAEVNNYLLPLFMIVLGVALIRWPARPLPAS